MPNVTDLAGGGRNLAQADLTPDTAIRDEAQGHAERPHDNAQGQSEREAHPTLVGRKYAEARIWPP
jgi:hypothetical protein